MSEMSGLNTLHSTSNEGVSVKKSKTGSVVYTESPFMRGYVVATTPKKQTVARGTAILRPGDDAEKEALTTVSQVIDVDKKTFVKLFKTDDFKVIHSLTAPGLRMLMVFLDLCSQPDGINKIHIRCTWPKVQTLTGLDEKDFSYMTYNRGLKDLLQNRYIAAAEIDGETAGWFFIDQDKIFNGNRVKFVKEYRLAQANKTYPTEVSRTPAAPPAIKSRARIGGGDVGDEDDDQATLIDELKNQLTEQKAIIDMLMDRKNKGAIND